MRTVIVPKSTQTNADDLIGGPRTIRITGVKIAPSGEQRVAISYDGDDGKPWMPCKSMCRVLVEAWGPDANQYAGRFVTLYKDPKVKWGGLEVGGIRISHLSHIDRDMVMALTETRGKRSPYLVRVLQDAPQPKPQPKAAGGKVEQMVEHLLGRIEAASGLDALLAFHADEKVTEQFAYLKNKQPAHYSRVFEAFALREAALSTERTPGSDDE